MTKDRKPKKYKKNKKIEYQLDGMPSSDLKMKYYKKKREQKRLTNTIFQMHFFVKILAILALLWLSSKLMICHFWFLPQNTFDLYPNKHIKIIGNNITSNQKIISSMKKIPIPNKPIYLINTSDYEKELEKLSPVKKAFVRRYWLPSRFEITIEEEIPVLTISPNPNAPSIAAITLNNHVITREYLPIKSKQYKIYKILTYDNYSNWTKHEINSLRILSERIEDFSGEKLIFLDIRNKNDVYAQLETIKIRIGELNSTLKERIERLSSIMPQIEDLKSQTDYVDLRWDNTTFLKKRAKNTPPPPVYKIEEELTEQAAVEAQEKTTASKSDNQKNETTTKNIDKSETGQKATTGKKVEKTETIKPANKVENKTPVQQKLPAVTHKSSPQPQPSQKAKSKPNNNIQQGLPPMDIKVVEP